MKAMEKLKIALAFLSLSGSLCAQLSGTFDKCDAGTTAFSWYIGGNYLAPLAPPPHASPAPMDLGTCSFDPLILKSNNLQSVFIMPTGFIGLNNSSPNAALDIKNPTTGQQSSFRIYGDLNGNVESTTGMRFNFANGKDLLFNEGTSTSNTTRMTIKHGGQVSIGNPLATSSSYASTALLTVKGQVVAQEVIVSLQSGSWPDFVFDKNYKLTPLSDLETFYNKHHHLPNIPSAKEIGLKGNDLGKTDELLLQKIEELTIYIVDLEKRLKKVEGQ